MEKDWRLGNQMQYLFGKKLLQRTFAAVGERDHAHCAFCWDKFSPRDGDLHQGYCTEDQYWWICEPCYQDFKDQFQWTLSA